MRSCWNSNYFRNSTSNAFSLTFLDMSACSIGTTDLISLVAGLVNLPSRIRLELKFNAVDFVSPDFLPLFKYTLPFLSGNPLEPPQLREMDVNDLEAYVENLSHQAICVRQHR